MASELTLCYTLFMSTLIWDYKCLLNPINLVKVSAKGGKLGYHPIYLLLLVVTHRLAVAIHIHLQLHIVVTEPVDRVLIQYNLVTQHQSLILLGRS